MHLQTLHQIHATYPRKAPLGYHTSGTPKLCQNSLKWMTTKGVGKRGMGKVCPTYGLSKCFPIFLSLSTLCFLTMLTVLPLAAGRPRPRPAIHLPVILLHVNALLFNSSKRDFPSAVDYLPYVPGYQSRHCCHFFLLTVFSSLFTTTLP